ncbi:MAG: beta-galactosidase [Lachnospiraceae bacterium]|nr:beta-galactosidase [Lachnospiraceae bacterium]
MEKLLYGAAYYDEYMPEERLARDVEMLKKAHMNVVRIAESTWSTLEPTEGVFDFGSVDRVLQAMHQGGISVIIGTPTYAVPSWLVKKDPDVLATTGTGRQLYGPRQIMDITNETYLYHAERVIRELISHTASHPAVIGFQVDNETKYYDTAGPKVQEAFVRYLQKKFDGDIEWMNAAFGLNYWSNAVHDWADFPDVRNTINASLFGEFEKFRRKIVTDFLAWQCTLVREYMRGDQFITHNFDFDWRGFSYGVQPAVDHFAAAQALTVAGCDIYHPTQSHLTGMEISFGGALNYSLKGRNYLLLETEAQGFPQWTPYDQQLRLQAFSHIGSGAKMVEYWHWHSIHNAAETYWKGVLSHDFSENVVYKEACTIGADFERLSPKLCGLKKENRAAFLVSNISLTALLRMRSGGNVGYNETLMKWFRALYEMNYECDFVYADPFESEKPDDWGTVEAALYEKLKKYDLILAPALYAASDATVAALWRYTAEGGTLVSGYKSFFSDENTKVRHDRQPHGMTEVFGLQYNQFSMAENMMLSDGSGPLNGFFECLIPDGGEPVLSYAHKNWGKYAAVVKNRFEKGRALYLGCDLPEALLKKFLSDALTEAGVSPVLPGVSFPLIAKKALSPQGKELLFLYNYSENPAELPCPEGSFTELLSEKPVYGKATIALPAWGFSILERQ